MLQTILSYSGKQQNYESRHLFFQEVGFDRKRIHIYIFKKKTQKGCGSLKYFLMSALRGFRKYGLAYIKFFFSYSSTVDSKLCNEGFDER